MTHAREIAINFAVFLALAVMTGFIGGYLLFIQLPEIPQ